MNRMAFECFVAWRYLLSRRKHAFISFISLVSVAGVALGVATLIVALGVMNGMSEDLKRKILGVNAHVFALGMGQGMRDYPTALAEARALDGVVEATPFIYSEVMLSGLAGVKGAVLRGVTRESLAEVLRLQSDPEQDDRSAEAGSRPRDDPEAMAEMREREAVLDRLDGPGKPGVVLGWELARTLKLEPGDPVYVLGQWARSATGEFTPRIRIFELAGVFRTGLYDYDASVAYISLAQAKALLDMPETMATGLELRLANPDRADQVAEAVATALGPGVFTRHWKELNANLFATLTLERVGMLVVLVVIVLLAAFSIVTTLALMVMEKSKDIATLMALGARREAVGRIFVIQGGLIGITGAATGFVLGVALALSLKRYQFVELPQGVYTMDTLPILLQWQDLALTAGLPVLFCLLATLYPARQAARVNPSLQLRGK